MTKTINDLSLDSLSRVLFSSINSIPNSKTELMTSQNSYLFRILSFNAELQGAHGIKEGASIVIGNSDDSYRDNAKETIASIKKTIVEHNGAPNIEFISIDDLTKSVIVFTRDYVDDLVSGKKYIGDLILNYYNLWHLNKTGVRGAIGAEKHNLQFKTFSKLEEQRLDEAYMPIAVASKSLPIIGDYLDTVLSVCQLEPYLKKESAYGPNGKRVDGSVCYWLPKLVAREYIQETEPHKILARKVLDKLMRDCGLYDTPAIKDFLPLNLSHLSTQEVKETVNQMAHEKLGITTDFRVRDTASVRQDAVIDKTVVRRMPNLS